jgi:hypothetical protein
MENMLNNEGLQKILTKCIVDLNFNSANADHNKAIFMGARVLLQSIKIDLEGARLANVPMFKRTKKFLDIK